MDATAVEEKCRTLVDEVSRAVIVDDDVLETILAGFQAGGHVLLEDAPGTGKTLTARCFSTVLGLSYSRIQFTPDLLPSDVTGTHVYDETDASFEFQPGPIFANVVLADEINRASPKTQAALLEAMEEGQVTVDGTTHELPDPFFVIATQNPVEQEGTFPLPEAQKDRFVVKTSLGYPPLEGELELLDRRAARTTQTPTVTTICDDEAVAVLREAPEKVQVDEDVRRYVATLTRATRDDERVEGGVSPRGTQRLFEVARAVAVGNGRQYVFPEDVKSVAGSVLAHRLVLTADARVDNVEKADIIDDITEETQVPTVNYKARASA